MADATGGAATGDDDYAVIGWLFSARDDASVVAERMQELIEVVVSAVRRHLGDASSAVEDTAEHVSAEVQAAGLEVQEAVTAPLEAINDTFSEALDEMGGTAEEGAAGILRPFEEVPEEASRIANAVKDATLYPIRLIGGSFKSVFTDLGQTVLDGAKAVVDQAKAMAESVLAPFVNIKRAIFDTELSFRGLADVVGKVTGGAFSLLGAAIKDMGGLAVSASVRVGELVQKFISIDTLAKGLKGAGGIIGALLGPFGAILGPLMRLFSPLVSMIVEGLMPAVETFTAILKTSFAPLFELAELLAQSLAPMIQEFLAPFVAGLEVIAVQAAGFVMSLLRGGGAMGGIASMFQSLGPIIMDIFRSLGGMAAELLPVVFETFRDLAPVALEVVRTIAGFVRDLLPELLKVFKEVGPLMLKTFAELLKALVPLMPPLAKLALTLVKTVFGPASIAAMTWFAKWLKNDIIPFIEEWMPVVVDLIDDISEAVAHFFDPDNFKKYMKDFYILFIKPIGDAFKGILDKLGLGDVDWGGLWNDLKTSFMAPLTVLKRGVNALIIDPLNDVLRWSPPLTDRNLGSFIGVDPPVAYLARGAIFPPQPGGTAALTSAGSPVVLAEGGAPEVLMPLSPEGIQATIPPMLSEAVELPGLERAVAELQAIRRLLAGTLQVDTGAQASTQGASEFAELDGGVGVLGVL